MQDQEPVATLSASLGRRYMAYGVIFVLGALLVFLALKQPPALGWQLFLIALGVTALIVAERLRRATQLGLVLTETELRDTSGHVLTRIDNIASIDRGAFAFKPSHGFVLRLHHREERAWAPGLWWRFSKRLGVGGVTPSGSAKFMAEQIALRIAPD